MISCLQVIAAISHQVADSLPPINHSRLPGSPQSYRTRVR